tara:strand:- start:200 stop:433 length:234 start_codon:yes stop_codon:yes gene_type:complete
MSLTMSDGAGAGALVGCATGAAGAVVGAGAGAAAGASASSSSSAPQAIASKPTRLTATASSNSRVLIFNEVAIESPP